MKRSVIIVTGVIYATIVIALWFAIVLFSSPACNIVCADSDNSHEFVRIARIGYDQVFVSGGDRPIGTVIIENPYESDLYDMVCVGSGYIASEVVGCPTDIVKIGDTFDLNLMPSEYEGEYDRGKIALTFSEVNGETDLNVTITCGGPVTLSKESIFAGCGDLKDSSKLFLLLFTTLTIIIIAHLAFIKFKEDSEKNKKEEN